MGCLHADVSLVGGLDSRVCNANCLSVEYELTQGCAVKITLLVSSVSDLKTNVDYEKALKLAQASNCNVPIFVRLDPVCQFIPTYYLEIEPEFIWVYSNWEVENQVFSNTDWHIN